MKKINKYILIKYIHSVFLALTAFVGIFILSQIFKVIKYVTSGRLTPIEGVEYMGAQIPEIFVQVAPLAALIGGLITVNKMASSLEIVALKTSGISFIKIIKMPIIATVFLTMMVFYVSSTLEPASIKKSIELKRKNQIADDKVPISKTDVYLRGNGNYIYHFDYINRKTQSARGVEIVILNKNFDKIKTIITAKSANYSNKWGWELKSANENIIDKRLVISHKIYKNSLLKESPELFLTPRYDKKELSLKELKRISVLLKKTGGQYREFEVEFNQKIAYPFSCLIMAILGLSLGSKYVRGSSALNIALSVFLGYGYYIVQASFESIALGGAMRPFIAVWIPNLIFLIIALITLNRAEY